MYRIPITCTPRMRHGRPRLALVAPPLVLVQPWRYQKYDIRHSLDFASYSRSARDAAVRPHCRCKAATAVHSEDAGLCTIEVRFTKALSPPEISLQNPSLQPRCRNAEAAQDTRAG